MSRHHNLATKFFSLTFVLLAGLTIVSAAPSDRTRADAEKLVAEAEALTEKRTEQSYQQAMEKYQAAVSISFSSLPGGLRPRRYAVASSAGSSVAFYLR
jgi:hypothetical protein